MSSYAYGGSQTWVPCTTNPLTGEHEHHYPTPGVIGLEFARPVPSHALTPGALAAVARMRHARALDLTTDVGNPRVIPHSGKPPTALVRMERLAVAAGFTVSRVESVTGHALQGRRGDEAFRAYWQHGRTRGATWHERKARWALVEDRREIRVDKVAKTGLKGARSAGMGGVRLVLLAAPWGLPLSITELEERLSS